MKTELLQGEAALFRLEIWGNGTGKIRGILFSTETRLKTSEAESFPLIYRWIGTSFHSEEYQNEAELLEAVNDYLNPIPLNNEQSMKKHLGLGEQD